jgi:hypothetical protein
VRKLSLLTSLLILSIGTANASLIGDAVGCSPDFQSSNLLCSPSDAIVGGATEFTVTYNGGDYFYFDLDEDSLKITASPAANPGIGWGFTITGLDWNGSANLVGIDNFFSNVGPMEPSDSRFPTGVIESDIRIGSDYVHFNLGTSNWEAGDYVSFNLISDVTVVPIPAAVWLFGSALAGLGWMRRRKTV